MNGVSVVGEINGAKVYDVGTIKGTGVNSVGVLSGKVQISKGYDTYNGVYIVNPDVETQVLETAHKVMREDVVVEKVHVYKVQNAAKGDTVIIGGNLDG